MRRSVGSIRASGVHRARLCANSVARAAAALTAATGRPSSRATRSRSAPVGAIRSVVANRSTISSSRSAGVWPSRAAAWVSSPARSVRSARSIVVSWPTSAARRCRDGRSRCAPQSLSGASDRVASVAMVVAVASLPAPSPKMVTRPNMAYRQDGPESRSSTWAAANSAAPASQGDHSGSAAKARNFTPWSGWSVASATSRPNRARWRAASWSGRVSSTELASSRVACTRAAKYVQARGSSRNSRSDRPIAMRISR